ncbi:MAG: methyltransferase domain-containing protein [Salinarimonadaceae bacterium]|nr:MAG: methyltransferase domain-containing protein [Salinarimonadaceae bacterium]
MTNRKNRRSGPGGRPRAASDPTPPAEGLGPRRLALRVLDEIGRTRRPLDDAFDDGAGEGGLSARDVGLARAICLAALRRRGTIRAAISARLAKPMHDERLFTLLLVGAAQVLFLDIPDHAAVATSVDLAREERATQRYAGLVNAVLRRIVREREAVLAESDPLADVPDWLATGWIEAYGREAVIAMAQIHRREAPLDLSVRGDAAAWAERLGARLLPTGSLRLADRTEVVALPGYDEGAWWVQDAAAAIPARLLAVRPGERVADLCAAPGGKTAQLAAAGANVVAVDRTAKRLARVVENIERLGLSAEIRAMDVLAMEDEESFDAILLDAPCSATGTLRRRPDVAWTKTREDVGKLAALQTKLLDKAADMLAPGGRLVFCTCSLEQAEGERQARAFLARRPEMERLPVTDVEIGGLTACVTPEGDFRSLPHLGGEAMVEGLDGFFAARFRKRKA